jgi:hypothetical protein
MEWVTWICWLLGHLTVYDGWNSTDGFHFHMYGWVTGYGWN